MKRLLISALAGAALAGAVTPALAQPLGGAGVNAREARIEARIDQGARSGDLTRQEARRLRAELRRINDLERYYRRTDGLSAWERRDLEHRLDRLSGQVFGQRHDWDRRRG